MKKTIVTINVLVIGFLTLLSVKAYEPDVAHVALTRLAIKHFQSCYDRPVLSQKEQRRILQGNSAMDHGTWSFSQADNNLPYALLTFHYISRLTNWHFLPPSPPQTSRQGKFEMSNRRLWSWGLKGLKANPDRYDKLLFLGALIHLTEDVSVPAHALPVYHGPVAVKQIGDFGHLVDGLAQTDLQRGYGVLALISDPIDKIAPNINKLSQHLNHIQPQLCLPATGRSASDILTTLGNDTLLALAQPIANCPSVHWRQFWLPTVTAPDSPAKSYFKHYNLDFPLFGTKGQLGASQCMMAENDNRYHQFLFERHLAAVKANIQLLHWFHHN